MVILDVCSWSLDSLPSEVRHIWSGVVSRLTCITNIREKLLKEETVGVYCWSLVIKYQLRPL